MLNEISRQKSSPVALVWNATMMVATGYQSSESVNTGLRPNLMKSPANVAAMKAPSPGKPNKELVLEPLVCGARPYARERGCNHLSCTENIVNQLATAEPQIS